MCCSWIMNFPSTCFSSYPICPGQCLGHVTRHPPFLWAVVMLYPSWSSVSGALLSISSYESEHRNILPPRDEPDRMAGFSMWMLSCRSQACSNWDVRKGMVCGVLNGIRVTQKGPQVFTGMGTIKPACITEKHRLRENTIIDCALDPFSLARNSMVG